MRMINGMRCHPERSEGSARLAHGEKLSTAKDAEKSREERKEVLSPELRVRVTPHLWYATVNWHPARKNLKTLRRAENVRRTQRKALNRKGRKEKPRRAQRKAESATLRKRRSEKSSPRRTQGNTREYKSVKRRLRFFSGRSVIKSFWSTLSTQSY
jgi:hypothetical protein